MAELQGRTALVTGANRGIGKGIARALVGAGARVAMAARTADTLEAAAAELQAENSAAEVLAVSTDVIDEGQVQALFSRIDEHFGQLDILVNNAGAFDGGPIEEVSLEAWNNVIGACLTGAFLCTREAFRRMKPRGGRILNIGSISAQRSRLNAAPYTAAKFGIWGLTQASALEGRDFGIAVSCLHPGNVLVERRQGSGKTSDEEPMMSVEEIASTALHMLTMPPHVNVLEAIVLPTQQQYLGRG